MKIEKIDTVIAEREIDGQQNGRPFKVIVRLGRPFLDETGDGPCWCCQYSIMSPVGEHIFYGAGLDSLQALRIAISMVSSELSTTYAEFGLKWCGEDDLGFGSKL